MQLENTNIDQLQIDLKILDDILPKHGLIRAGQWDYERVTYDRKIVLNEHVYYLRIQGFAVSGDVGSNKALIRLKVPILGKYYYPHGVEYGEDENFPKSLVAECEEILSAVEKDLKPFHINTEIENDNSLTKRS